MYIGYLIKNIFKKNNIAVLIYALANVGILFGLFFLLAPFVFADQPEDKIKLYNGLIGIAIYFGGSLIFLSPLGEAFFRFSYGLKSIERFEKLGYVQAAFNEVYAKASEQFPGLPKGVKLYIKRSNVQNAAAVGRKTIFLTEGILSLPTEQLKGVLAHELAHLYKGDTVVLLLVLTGNVLINIIASIIKLVLTIVANMFLIFGEDSFANRIAMFFVIMITKLLIDGILALWTVIGLLLKNVSSKQAEFEADEFACSLGYGRHLAGALLAISSRDRSENLGETPSILDRALASHPDTNERVRRCGVAV